MSYIIILYEYFLAKNILQCPQHKIAKYMERSVCNRQTIHPDYCDTPSIDGQTCSTCCIICPHGTIHTQTVVPGKLCVATCNEGYCCSVYSLRTSTSVSSSTNMTSTTPSAGTYQLKVFFVIFNEVNRFLHVLFYPTSSSTCWGIPKSGNIVKYLTPDSKDSVGDTMGQQASVESLCPDLRTHMTFSSEMIL